MSYGQERDPKRSTSGMPTPPPNLRPGSSKPVVKPPTVKKTLPATDPASSRPHAPVPPPDEEEYAIRPSEEYAIRAEPVAPPVLIPVPRVREPVITQDPVPDPPALPFWTGVFSFPFYLQSLGVWMLISMGLTVGALGIVLCIWTLERGLTPAFRCLVMPVFLIIAFTCCYGSAACKTITLTTADGYDEVDDWPTGDWREWAWTLTYPVGMFLVAALLGAAAQWLLSLSPGRGSPLGLAQTLGLPFPALSVIFLVYPVLLLSALEAGSATTPVSLSVLRSLLQVWWGWALFYLETGVLFVAWLAFVLFGCLVNLWLAAAIAAPLAAALAMIYSRLLGRLAWCIDRHLKPLGEGDEA